MHLSGKRNETRGEENSVDLGMLSILPSRPIRDQWEYPWKMERHFPIKPGQQIGMALATFFSFSEFPNLGQRTGLSNFGRNIPTEISGTPPEVIPIFRSEETETYLSISIPTETTGIFGKHPLKVPA